LGHRGCGSWIARPRSQRQQEIIMKRLSIVIAFLAAGLLVGCNTMQVAGKDIERGGEKLQDSAQKAKERM